MVWYCEEEHESPYDSAQNEDQLPDELMVQGVE